MLHSNSGSPCGLDIEPPIALKGLSFKNQGVFPLLCQSQMVNKS